MNALRDWLHTFALVVIRPLPSTYRAEARKAQGKFGSALAWTVFYTFILNLYVALLPQGAFQVETLLVTLLLIPLGFLLFVFSLHLVCRRVFGMRQDRYDEFLYLVVANFVPFIVINLLLVWNPTVSAAFTNVAFFYPLILTIVAVRAITGLRLWQSVIAVVLAAILASVGWLCIGAFMFSVMGTVPRII